MLNITNNIKFENENLPFALNIIQTIQQLNLINDNIVIVYNKNSQHFKTMHNFINMFNFFSNNNTNVYVVDNINDFKLIPQINEQQIILINIECLMYNNYHKSSLNNFILLKNDMEFEFDILSTLISNQYERVDTVRMPFEFACRGEILDISLSESNCYRIIFENTIHNISLFDIQTQLSIQDIHRSIYIPINLNANNETKDERTLFDIVNINSLFIDSSVLNIVNQEFLYNNMIKNNTNALPHKDLCDKINLCRQIYTIF